MKKVGLFSGSFDPPTLGHLEIIERCTKNNLVDFLIVAVAINPEKKENLLSVEERMFLLNEMTSHLLNVKITSYTGLTATFAKEQKASFLIRGVRSALNFEEEKRLSFANKKLCQLETLLLPAFGKHQEITGTLVRQIARNKGDLTEFVPKCVKESLSK